MSIINCHQTLPACQRRVIAHSIELYLFTVHNAAAIASSSRIHLLILLYSLQEYPRECSYIHSSLKLHKADYMLSSTFGGGVSSESEIYVQLR